MLAEAAETAEALGAERAPTTLVEVLAPADAAAETPVTDS